MSTEAHCIVCGCTEARACVINGRPCAWLVAPHGEDCGGICTACAKTGGAWLIRARVTGDAARTEFVERLRAIAEVKASHFRGHTTYEVRVARMDGNSIRRELPPGTCLRDIALLCDNELAWGGRIEPLGSLMYRVQIFNGD